MKPLNPLRFASSPTRLGATLATLALAASLAACGDDDEAPPAPTGSTIAELAAATPNLATLVAVVEYASEDGDLLGIISNPGTLTVFAPTNAAFDALAVELTADDTATAAALLTPENKPLLRSVLTYHVLTSEVFAAAIPFGSPITTAQTGYFKIDSGTPPQITDGRNRVSGITTTDIDATNGVVHVIDRVLLPPDMDVVEVALATAENDEEFTLLTEALVAADLVDTLQGVGPFTVFAPTDAAFVSLLTELNLTKEELFADVPLLTAVLTYHVVPDLVLAADVPLETAIETVQGEAFEVGADLAITDARDRMADIIQTDILASNGVIHVIDKVILPAP